MGYYSNVMIATTKSDFEKIKRAQEKCEFNILNTEAEVSDYQENGKDFVFLTLYSIKYYKEFEEIQALEKSLNKLKDGYVFCRMGEENGDIEFRNRTKLPELMKEFDFIKELNKTLNEELKECEEEEEFE